MGLFLFRIIFFFFPPFVFFFFFFFFLGGGGGGTKKFSLVIEIWGFADCSRNLVLVPKG